MEEELEDVKVKDSTKFQSPLPFLIQFRNLVFGKKKPDIFTRVTFFMNLFIWMTFLLWDIISYFSISSRDFILSEKGVSVEKIIERRGNALGFKSGEFLSRLLTFHGIAIICWLVMFFGLILLYRKKLDFIYFILSSVLFYIGMSIFYVSYTYFIEDTTTYDKIALLIVIASSLLHFFLMRNEKKGGSINFFGSTEEEH